jgi:hypothetical protein
MSAQALWVLALCCYVQAWGQAVASPQPTLPESGPPQRWLPVERKAAGEWDRLAIYSRQTNRWGQVWLYKPQEPITTEPIFDLAPLVLQQFQGSDSRLPHQNAFGELISRGGELQVDTARPAIYFTASVTELHGRAHAQLSYLWFYREPDRHGTADWTGLQGVRMTLDSSGKPAIWELFADRSGAELIFVSRSVEAAAAAEYDRPLAGRRYVVEPDLKTFPNVVVPRVIEDGPMAMGPIIYLEASRGSALTLICRCMPAQAGQVFGSTIYTLIDTSTNRPDLLLTSADAALATRLAAWRSGEGNYRLDRRLRLPASF